MSDGQPERIKFVVLYTNRRRVKMGARLQGHFYSQEFDRTVLLGDAVDVLRSRVIRMASGLDELDDENQQTEF